MDKYTSVLHFFQSPEEEVYSAVNAALEAGYRLIDTAFVYRNEAAIGKVLKKWFDSKMIKRDEVFVVTKVTYFIFNVKEIKCN